MFTLAVIIHLTVSVILIITVLLQAGKGASIGSSFGGGSSSQTVFGSAGPATILMKITWVCAVIFMLTSLFMTYSVSKAKKSSIMSSVPAVAAPPKPAEAPAAPVAPAVPAEKSALPPVTPIQK